MERKRAQAWGFDLVIGMVIFIVGIVSFYLYASNLPGASEEIIEKLQQEGELIAESLMSEGSPIDWNTTRVERIGITSENRINETKWNAFKNLASTDYSRTKSLFRVKDEYFVFIGEDESGGAGNNPSSPTNLVKVTRVIIYNQSIKTLNVYSWN